MNARVLITAGVTVTAIAAAGLAYYFTQVGLDQADKTASVLGIFVGLAGLLLAGYGTVAAKKAAAEPTQTVSGSSISGSNIQIGQVGTSLRIKRSGQGATPAPPQGSPAPHNSNSGTPGQSVTNSRISGMNLQVGQVAGDAEVEESP
ncbi:hypothetical protein ACIA6E_17655 [Streptomyces sp. NPDC051815]|uniref:hypothetical protein n=1 Tax=Streptomyces sp. NPDC051815 TaxID=3365674 RepID=UPI0037ADA7AB